MVYYRSGDLANASQNFHPRFDGGSCKLHFILVRQEFSGLTSSKHADGYFFDGPGVFTPIAPIDHTHSIQHVTLKLSWDLRLSDIL